MSANELRVKANRICWPCALEEGIQLFAEARACASEAWQKDCGLVILFDLQGKGQERKEAFLLT